VFIVHVVCWAPQKCEAVLMPVQLAEAEAMWYPYYGAVAWACAYEAFLFSSVSSQTAKLETHSF